MTNEDVIADIRKGLKTDKMLIGRRRCIKQLKLGKLSKLFLAANCPADALEDIKHYSSMDSVEVVQLDIKNDELGMLCKRQHNISMLGIQK